MLCLTLEAFGVTHFCVARNGLNGGICALVNVCRTCCCCRCTPAGHLTPMLGVFQKLIASKANDVYGFMLLRGIIEHLPLSAYQQFMPQIWQLLFTRLQVCLCLQQG